MSSLPPLLFVAVDSIYVAAILQCANKESVLMICCNSKTFNNQTMENVENITNFPSNHTESNPFTHMQGISANIYDFEDFNNHVLYKLSLGETSRSPSLKIQSTSSTNESDGLIIIYYDKIVCRKYEFQYESNGLRLLFSKEIKTIVNIRHVDIIPTTIIMETEPSRRIATWHIVTVEGSVVVIRDIQLHTIQSFQDSSSNITALCFLSSNLLVVTNEENRMQVYDINQGKLLLSEKRDGKLVSFSSSTSFSSSSLSSIIHIQFVDSYLRSDGNVISKGMNKRIDIQCYKFVISTEEGTLYFYELCIPNTTTVLDDGDDDITHNFQKSRIRINEIGVLNTMKECRYALLGLVDDVDIENSSIKLRSESNFYPLALSCSSKMNAFSDNLLFYATETMRTTTIICLVTHRLIIMVDAKSRRIISTNDLNTSHISRISQVSISWHNLDLDDNNNSRNKLVHSNPLTCTLAFITAFEKLGKYCFLRPISTVPSTLTSINDSMISYIDNHDLHSIDSKRLDNHLSSERQLSLFLSSSDLIPEESDDIDDDRTNHDRTNHDNIKVKNNLLLLSISPKITLTPAVLSSLSSSSKNKISWEAPGKDKNGKLIDQPITFHNRIKSSGYGKIPQGSYERMKLKKEQMKQHQIAMQRKEQMSSRMISNSNQKTTMNEAESNIRRKGPIVATVNKVYLIDSTCPIQPQHHLTYPSNIPSQSISLSPIYKVVYNEDGSYLASLTTQQSIQSIHLPQSKYKEQGRIYRGHDGRLNDIHYSHDNDMILSSSADGTSRLWKSSDVDSPAIIFSHTLHQPSSILSSSSSSLFSSMRNKPFVSEVVAGKFYYMDKFITMAVKSNVYLYLYDLEDYENVDDIKRMESRGRYELAHKWILPGQSITAFACLNRIQSPILFAATSNKKLCILDSVTGNIAREIDSCHEKSIHHISLPQPSTHVPLSMSTPEYNIFATMAIDNTIALWDIRSSTVIARYSNHVNRREAVGCSISPCLRYLATGSEDRSCRIVDIRGGLRELHRLGGYHRDVVMDAQWHPINSQLATASLDGTIRFYSSPESISPSSSSSSSSLVAYHSTRTHRLAIK